MAIAFENIYLTFYFHQINAAPFIDDIYPIVIFIMTPVTTSAIRDTEGSRKLAMKREAGFTLIELMVTLVVLAVGFSVVLPPLTKLFRTNLIGAEANNFLTQLI